MGVSLQKGGNISLTKSEPGLEEIIIGLGWDPRATAGADFDADASAFLLGASGKVRSDADFIFYNQKETADGSIKHMGDNRTGAGEGDDEQIVVQLNKVHADVQRIVVSVTIHEAAARKQNFGQIQKAFIRIVNKKTGNEIAKFDLSEDASVETAMVFGEVYRNGTEWKFKAVGQGFAGGLEPLAKSYGVNIG
jgi:tellurium resistance protein TerD